MATKTKNNKKTVTKASKRSYTKKYQAGGPYAGLGLGFMDQRLAGQQANFDSLFQDPVTSKAGARVMFSNKELPGTLGANMNLSTYPTMDNMHTRNLPPASDPRVQQMASYIRETVPMNNTKLLLNTPKSGIAGALGNIDTKNLGAQVMGGLKAGKNLRSLKKSGYSFAKGGQVPEYGFGGVMAEMAMGAGTGAVAGGGVLSLPGALIGGGVGLIKGLASEIGASQEKKQQEELARVERSNTMRELQSQGSINNYMPTFKFGGMFKGKKVSRPNAEVEGNEMIVLPDGTMSKVNGPSHEKGGVKVRMPAGSFVFSDRVKIEDGKSAAEIVQKEGLNSKMNKTIEGLSKNTTRLNKNSLERNMIRYTSRAKDLMMKQEATKVPTFAEGGMLPKFQGGGPNDFYSQFMSHLQKSPNMPDYTGMGIGFMNNRPVQNQQSGIGNGYSINPLFNRGGNPFLDELGLNPNPNFSNQYNNPYLDPAAADPWASYTGNNPAYGGTGNIVNPGAVGSKNAGSSINRGTMNPSHDSRTGYQLNPNKLVGQAGFQQMNPNFGENMAGPTSSPNGLKAGLGRAGEFLNKNSAIIGGITDALPSIYNIIQGLRKPQKLNANDFYNPYNEEIRNTMRNRRFNIDPTLQSNIAAQAMNNYNIGQVGTARGEIMGNMTASQNARMGADAAAFAQKQNMDNQYLAEQAQMDYGLGRDRAQTKFNIQDVNDRNAAAKRAFLAQAATGLQQRSLVNRQMSNQDAQQRLMIEAMMAYSPYTAQWLPGLETYGQRRVR